MFEALRIPFIGSGMHQVVLAMNKVMTRGVMMECHIPCPPGKVIQADSRIKSSQFEYPCVVKPTTTENSVGMTLVKAPGQLKAALELAFKYSKDVIVDRFIEGTTFLNQLAVYNLVNNPSERPLTLRERDWLAKSRQPIRLFQAEYHDFCVVFSQVS